MKKLFLFLPLFFCLGSFLAADPAAPVATPFEKLLYEKSRADVLLKLSDADLLSYCTTLKWGGDQLQSLQKGVWEAETDLASTRALGYTDEHPKMQSLKATLEVRQKQLTAQISSLRKGLKIESEIAQNTLAALAKEKKTVF